jgi:hypothetical protein
MPPRYPPHHNHGRFHRIMRLLTGRACYCYNNRGQASYFFLNDDQNRFLTQQVLNDIANNQSVLFHNSSFYVKRQFHKWFVSFDGRTFYQVYLYRPYRHPRHPYREFTPGRHGL